MNMCIFMLIDICLFLIVRGKKGRMVNIVVRKVSVYVKDIDGDVNVNFNGDNI